jgi:hypothetical protein
MFSYSKWELTAGHPLYKAMGEMMATPEVREAIHRHFWIDETGKQQGYLDAAGVPALGNISDYFVSAFGNGDFLSTHSDGASGSLAWVLHLSPEESWDVSSGGALRFNSGSVVRSNRDFAPSFNRLLLFLTRPGNVPHQVLPVVRAPGAEPRFGITGWYMTRGDKFDVATTIQNEKMRAAASKASSGDMCM